MAVLVLTVLVGAAVGFVHGEPEASDDPERSRSAHEMLTRLWSAARERVDAIRKTRADQQGQGHPEPAMSNSDMFASALDYVRDKVKHPPLLSTERNLLTLHESIQLLAAEIIELRKAVAAAQPDCRIERATSGRLAAVLGHELVPVQGPRYTIINRTG